MVVLDMTIGAEGGVRRQGRVIEHVTVGYEGDDVVVVNHEASGRYEGEGVGKVVECRRGRMCWGGPKVWLHSCEQLA